MTGATRRGMRRSHAGPIVMLILGAVLFVAGPIAGMLTGSLAVLPRMLDADTPSSETVPPFDPAAVFGPIAWWGAAGIVASVAGIVLLILGIVGVSRAVAPGSSA